MFPGGSGDDVNRLDIFRIRYTLSVAPVERVNIRTDVIDVELLTEGIAVLFEQVRVGIVVLDSRRAGSVFKLSRVGVHGQQIYIRNLAGLFDVSVTNRRQTVVIVRSRLVCYVRSSKAGMIKVFRRLLSGIHIRAVAQNQFYPVLVAIIEKTLNFRSASPNGMSDHPVKSARFVPCDKFFIKDRVR